MLLDKFNNGILNSLINITNIIFINKIIIIILFMLLLSRFLLMLLTIVIENRTQVL